MASKSRENTGRWSKHEHDVFINGLRKHGKEWKVIAALVGSRTVVQIRTHAQKYFQKLSKLGITNPVADIQRGRIPPFGGVKRARDEPRSPRKSVVAAASASDEDEDEDGAGRPRSSSSKAAKGRARLVVARSSAASGSRPRAGSSTTPGAFARVAPSGGKSLRPSGPRVRSASDATPGSAAWAPRSAGPRIISTHRAAPALDKAPAPPVNALPSPLVPVVEVAPVVDQGPPSTAFVRLPVLNVYGSVTREYGVDSSYPHRLDDASLAGSDGHDAAPSPLPVGVGVGVGVGDVSPTGVTDVLYAFPTGDIKENDRVSPVPTLTDILNSGASGWFSQDSVAAAGFNTQPSSTKRQRTSYAGQHVNRPRASYAKHPVSFDVDAFVDGLLAGH